MYNRYIPQPDGSYSRRRMQDPPAVQSASKEENRPRQEQWRPEPEPVPISQPAFSPGPQSQPRQQQRFCRPRPNPRPSSPPPRNDSRSGYHDKQQETSVLSFLKQLLPKDFDTGDLLILLLLLLMSGDCQEDQNTAILTLVLYLFL